MAKAAREARESEKIMTSIWVLIPHLVNCVWYPLPDAARGYIRNIRKYLDALEHQLNEEEAEKNSN